MARKTRHAVLFVAFVFGVAAFVPLMSQNSLIAPEPPYDLDEAIQLVLQQTGGRVLRAETVTADQLVQSRGAPPPQDDADEECECADDEGTEDNGVRSRGVSPQEPLPVVHRIRILSANGEVRTVLVDEEGGLINQLGGAENEAVDR